MLRMETGDNIGGIPAKERVAAYRKRMQADGYRLIQMWVPDVEVLGEEIARQSRLISSSPEDKEALEFIGHVADWSE